MRRVRSPRVSPRTREGRPCRRSTLHTVLLRGAATRFHHGAPACSYLAADLAAGRGGLRAALVFLAGRTAFLLFPFFCIVFATIPPRNTKGVRFFKNCKCGCY